MKDKIIVRSCLREFYTSSDFAPDARLRGRPHLPGSDGKDRPFAVIRKADVRLDGEKLAELGDGRFVGQIAYITGEKAPVSIVAKRSTRIIS
jgi:hypothetical protein